MHEKKRAAGASALAAATILSGLGFTAPTASAATADGIGDRAAATYAADGLWIQRVVEDDVEKYVVLDGTDGSFDGDVKGRHLVGHEYATLADAVTEGRAHNWDQWVFPKAGTWGQIRFGADSCVYVRAYYQGTSQPSLWRKGGDVLVQTCSYPNIGQGTVNQLNGTWQVQDNGAVRNQWNAAFTGITTVPNRPDAAVYLGNSVQDTVFWQSGPDTSVGPVDPDPVVNGGVDAGGVGFDLSMQVGETKDLFVGQKATGSLTELDPATYTIQAPAGTKFDANAKAYLQSENTSGVWGNDSDATVTTSINAAGDTATVTITTTSGWTRDNGQRTRIGIPLTATAAGTGTAGFSATGTTNLGAFTLSGSSNVTVTAAPVVAPENNGFDTDGIGFSATVAEGKTVDVPFGLEATGNVSKLTLTDSELTAPGGTEFASGTTTAIAQVKRAGSTTWSALPAANATVTVAAGKKTATVSVTDATIALADGDSIRWSIPVTGLTAGADKQIAFSTTGTTNWGRFNASGSSSLTVTAPEVVAPAITSGPANNADTPATITYTGTAQTGSRIQIHDGNGTLKWSTTVKNGVWSAGPFSADTTKDLDLVFTNIVDGTTTQFATRHLNGVTAPIVDPVIVTGPAEGATVPTTTTYTGTAQTGSRIVVTDGDGNVWFSTTVKNGTWSISRVTDPLKPLELHFTNVVNGTEKEFAVRHLRAAIITPVITSGPADGSITPETGTFTGKASKNSRIIVKLSDGTTWFTTRADADTGEWSFSRNMDTSKTYTLEFYNEINGVQTKFATRTLNAIAKITAGPADQSENTGEIGFSGTALSGSRIQARLASDDSVWFSTTAQNGQWSFSRKWDKTKGLDIRFVNIVGTKEYVFDTRTIKPAAAATVPAEITSGPADGSTVDPAMSTFTGRGPAGQRIWVYDADNGNTLWWDTTIKNNTWSFTRTLKATKNYHFIFKVGTTEDTATQFAERTLHAAN